MTTVADRPELFPAEQAAEFIGVRPQTLALWRMTGRNALPFVKVGRLVRYRRDDLEAWLAERTGTNTRAIAAALA